MFDKIQHFFSHSLRRKFSVYLVLLFIFIFAIFSYILLSNNTRATESMITQEAESYSQLSVKPIVDAYNLYYNSGYLKFKEIIGNILSLNSSITRVRVANVNGEVLFDSQELENGETPAGGVDAQLLAMVNRSVKSEIYQVDNSRRLLIIVYPYFDDWQAHRYSVIYDVSYELVNQNAAKVGNLIILSIVVFLFVGILVLYVVTSRLVIAPVEWVTNGVQRITQGEYKYQIEARSDDEIGILAASANTMAQKLAQDIEKLKELDVLKNEFIAIAAHNLRTPVVHIRLDVDYLISKLKKKLDPKQDEFLRDIQTSNENLAVLVEDLLNLTTLENEKLKLSKFQPVDLVGTINEVTTSSSSQLKENNLRLETDFNGFKRAEVLGDASKLREVFGNLFENAIKYNKKNGQIKISLKSFGPDYVVSVADTGVGIKPEEVGHLFSKFHRGTSVLTYDYSGVGLGLYISKIIIDAHNGKIWAESKLGEGSTFYITLPRNEAGSPLPQTKYQLEK